MAGTSIAIATKGTDTYKYGEHYKSTHGRSTSFQCGCHVKGSIFNEMTGEKRGFLYNPTDLTYTRSANYAEITSPGLSHPIVQYINGNTTNFNVSLFLYDKPYSGLILDWEKFLDHFVPPVYNFRKGYKKPDVMLIQWSSFIEQCVAESITYNITEFSKMLEPTVCTVTLSLKTVGV